VGFVGVLSGPAGAIVGQPQLEGAEAAIQFLQDSGLAAPGVEYELLVRDDRGDPNVAASVTRELIDAGVVAVIGGGTSDTQLAMLPIVNEAEILDITTVGSTAIWDNAGIGAEHPWAFQVGESVEASVIPHVAYLSGDGAEASIAELSVAIAYGISQSEASARAAQEVGVEIISRDFPPTATSFTAQLRELQDSGAPGLLVWAFGPSAVQIVNDLKQIGWAPRIAGPLGLAEQSVIDAMGELAAGAAAGPVPNTFLADEEGAELSGLASEFYSRYTDISGTQGVDARTLVAAFGFDHMMVLNAAVAEAGSSDPAALRDALDSGMEIDGARGTYRFAPDQRQGLPDPADYGLARIDMPCTNGTCVRQQ
jgi:branched-chain amino acid transport system substrate-binding protein